MSKIRVNFEGFFNLLKIFVINCFWICSMMKVYIDCCVPAQIMYLGKIYFLRYGPANQISGFLNQQYFQNKTMKYPDFLYISTNS